MASTLVPLAQGCEELEAVTIIDLLRRGGVEVVTAGLASGPVTASRGVVLIPDTTLDQVLDRDFDMIILPGGVQGADNLEQDPRVIGLLQRMAAQDKYIAAVCAAPKVLAAAGLLEGKKATSYPGFLDKMDLPGMQFDQAPVVRDGRLTTSRGPGTAMDFALELLEILTDRATRERVEAALAR